MKNHVKKLCSIFLCLLLLCQLLSVTALASSEDELTLWELSEDEQTLSNGQTSYHRVSLPPNIKLDPATIYIYTESVIFDKDPYLSDMISNIYAPDADSEWIWIDAGHVYITKQGEQDLQPFLSGESGIYRLQSAQSERTADLDKSILTSLQDLSEHFGSSQKSVEVSALYNKERQDILFYDKSDSFYYLCGAIYVLDGSYYYLNYLTLGNQYFDADGNFSYRSGEVELTKLNEDLRADIEETVAKQDYRIPQYEYETDFELDFGSVDADFFWVGFVLFGILLPIPFLVIGLLLPHSKKRGYPKYWYLLSMIAAAWILCAILLGILIIL